MERCFTACESEEDKDRTEKLLKEVLQARLQDGSAYTIDWSREPLPGLVWVGDVGGRVVPCEAWAGYGSRRVGGPRYQELQREMNRKVGSRGNEVLVGGRPVGWGGDHGCWRGVHCLVVKRTLWTQKTWVCISFLHCNS